MIFRLALVEEVIAHGTRRESIRKAAMQLAFKMTLIAVSFVCGSLLLAWWIVVAPMAYFWAGFVALCGFIIWLFVRGDRA